MTSTKLHEKFLSDREEQNLNEKQHEPGVKLDTGKLLAGVVLRGFSRALLQVVKVGSYGVRKYTADGWTEVPNAECRYEDALYRHLLADMVGEEIDEESGMSHLAHAAWNALTLLELRERKNR